jgi:hypothetical protein
MHEQLTEDYCEYADIDLWKTMRWKIRTHIGEKMRWHELLEQDKVVDSLIKPE